MLIMALYYSGLHFLTLCLWNWFERIIVDMSEGSFIKWPWTETLRSRLLQVLFPSVSVKQHLSLVRVSKWFFFAKISHSFSSFFSMVFPYTTLSWFTVTPFKVLLLYISRAVSAGVLQPCIDRRLIGKNTAQAAERLHMTNWMAS